jgi:hypothetical protein
MIPDSCFFYLNGMFVQIGITKVMMVKEGKKEAWNGISFVLKKISGQFNKCKISSEQ